MSDPVQTAANIRRMGRTDLGRLHPVLEETGLFPPDLLEGMAGEAFDDAAQSLWLMAEDQGGAVGFAFARPEALTEGTWNLLALAVRPAAQGKGLGGALVRGVEAALRAQGARLLIIDTSGTAEFAPAQRLYARLGFAEVARLPDFWADTVDKVTFARRL